MKYKSVVKSFLKKSIAVFLALVLFLTSFIPGLQSPVSPHKAEAAGNSCSAGSVTSSQRPRARVGGVALDQAATFLANMDDITGAYYDATLDRIVFVGKKNTTLPEFDKDDLAVAIKGVIFNSSIPAVSIEDDANTATTGMKKVHYYGGIEDTKFGKILFDADIKLKKYVAGYDEAGQPVTSTVTGYKSFFDRLLENPNFNPTVPSNSRFWIVPQLITLKRDDAADSFVFDQVKMEVKTESIYSANDPAWDQAMTAFAQHHTQYFDNFAQETPSYTQAKQLGKIVSVIKWLADNDIATDFDWARDYAPKFLATPKETPKYFTPSRTGANGYSFAISGGGVQYTTANTYNADNGSSASLKTASEAVKAPKEDINWTFIKDGQTYESVAVAADAFRSMGSYATSTTDMSFPMAGDLSLAFGRTYSSFSGGQNGIGRGWSFLPAQLVDNKPLAQGALRGTCTGDTYSRRYKLAFTGSSGRETFTYWCPGSTYRVDDTGYNSQVSSTPVDINTTLLTVKLKDQTEYQFEEKTTKDEFKLLSARDKNGNVVTYNYDTSNKLTSLTDNKGHTITLNYNTKNLIASVVDWSGRTVKYTYDDQGNLLTVTDPNNGVTTYAYDLNFKLKTITDRVGKIVETNTYTPEAKMATHKDAANTTTTYTYDDVNKAVTQTDNLGRTGKTVYQNFDNATLVVQEIDAAGKSIKYTQSPVEYKPLSITDKNNNVTSFTYDTNGNTTSITYPNTKKINYTYNDKNLATKILDGRYGATPKDTTYTYDTKGNNTVKNEAGKITRFTFDTSGEMLSLTDPLSKKTTWTRDTFGNKLTEVDAASKSATFEYDTIARLKKATDPNLKATSYTYDNNGNVLTVNDGIGTTTNVYDKENRQQKTTLPNNSVTQYTYNSSGTLNTVKDAAINTTTYGYDQYQNMTSKLDALNRNTQYAYDKLNRRTQRTTPLGKVAKWEYDANGNITKRIDENGDTVTYTYDNLNRLIRTTYPDPTQSAIVYTYDDRGNLIRVDSPSGPSVYAYDGFDRLISATDHYGDNIAYQYDNADNLTRITHPGGVSTTYTYDTNNRLKTVTDWANNITTYNYNNNSTVASRVLPNGVTTNYTYDNANRLTSVKHAQGTVTLAQLTYGRNNIGNIVTASESSVLDLPPSTQATGYTGEYFNNQTLTGSPTLTRTDSQINFVWGEGFASPAPSIPETHFSARWTKAINFSAGNYRFAVTADDGVRFYIDNVLLVDKWRDQGATIYYTIRNLTAGSHTLRMEYYQNIGGAIARLRYEAIPGLPATQTTTFNYNTVGRLLSGTYPGNTFSYTHDAVGNILTSTKNSQTSTNTYNADNQLTARNGTVFTYDNNGNLITQGQKTHDFSYENWLMSYTDPANSLQVNNEYEWNGNRIAKTVNGNRVIYANDTSGELPQVLASYDMATATMTDYVYGIGLISQGGNDPAFRQYYLDDGLGNVRYITDAGGSNIEAYTNDPYGNTIKGGNVSEFQYKKEQLDESGLYYLRARYYDPATGRFISKDPVEGAPALPESQNGYSFVHNDPVNQSDPSGKALPAVAAACAMAACRDGDCTNEVRATAATATTVYRAVSNGVTRYIGITNSFDRRAAEHLNNSGRVIQPILETSTRPEARAVEQSLINNYGLLNLDNKINSISPNNPIYNDALKIGNEILKNY